MRLAAAVVATAAAEYAAGVLRALTLIVAVALLAGLGGCKHTEYARVIAVVPRDVTAVGTSEHAGAAQEAANQGLSVYWNGPSYADDIEEQVLLVDRAVRQKSYGIIVSPLNPYALNAALGRALSTGIPVVVLGAGVPLHASPGLSFVLSDMHKPSDDAARYLAQHLPKGSEVMLAGLNPLSSGNIEAANQFLDALRRDAPDLVVVQQEQALFSVGQTELITERAIMNHPKLRAVFALDADTTGGAIAAVSNLKMQGQVRIIGCDQTLNLLYLLRHGALDGLLVQDMPQMAKLAVKQIAAERSGKPNATQIMVPGRLVTADNIDQDAVQGMLNMDWRHPS